MPPRERANTSRSRGDKSRQSTVPTVPTVPTARADSAAPGCPPEAESLPVAERGDWVAGDIVAELLDRVLGECSKAHAARQRVPFVSGKARDAIVRLVQWRFLARDAGTEEGAGTWQEDEEPEPLAAESWAQGSMPVLRVHPSPGGAEVCGVCAQCQHDPPAAAEAGAATVPPLPPNQVPSTGAIPPVPAPSHPELPPLDAVVGPRAPEENPARGPPPRPARALPPCPPAGQPGQRRCPPRSSHGGVDAGGVEGSPVLLPPLPPALCPSPATAQAGVKRREPGIAPGMPPRSRPERCVRPQVEVRDPDASPPPGPRWCSRGLELGRWQLPRGLGTTGGTRLPTPFPGSPRPPSSVLGSLLTPARLAPGVTIRWGGSAKRQVEEEEEEETERDLRPISPAVPVPAFAVTTPGTAPQS